MKVTELFEAKVLPDWVADEELEFRSMAKRLGFTVRKKPTQLRGRWVFGGELVDVDKNQTLGLEKRIIGMQKAVVRRFTELNRQGREVAMYRPSRYDYVAPGVWGPVEFAPVFIYPDDSPTAIENLVKERLFNNRTAGSNNNHIVFQYSVDEPKPKEEPKPVEKKVYRVVKGPK